jgi:aspartate kinase
MKVFKFGGASVKDVESIKNVAKVLKHEGFNNTIVIISAIGKMTNAFEKIVDAYFQKSSEISQNIAAVRNFHLQIATHLFENKEHDIFTEIEILFGNLGSFLIQNRSKNYNLIYDQIVGYGELLSTKIISAYLNEIEINNTWVDVRDYIKTDTFYRDAKVDWVETQKNIKQLKTETLIVTQGFLGSNKENKTTTLGREGSDFSAAIFAYCLQAENVTIWKDVPGVLNADPRFFKHTELLKHISYSEAIEMAFYGASVIHPKTLKPLENKNIPLCVRSFYDLENKGTTVSKGIELEPDVACYILKQHQILIAISAKDFSFMVEENLSDIFKILHQFKLKVNLIQNSALSFSVCIEDKYHTFSNFLQEIKLKYQITYTNNVSLYTIRHVTEQATAIIEKKGRLLLKQASKGTVQFIMKEF